MSAVVHNPDQIMAWQRHDLDGLIGKHVTVRVASDPAYWSNPHGYAGPWQHLHSGVVAVAVFDQRYEDGSTHDAWVALRYGGAPEYGDDVRITAAHVASRAGIDPTKEN